jgi:hypothetical protein
MDVIVFICLDVLVGYRIRVVFVIQIHVFLFAENALQVLESFSQVLVFKKLHSAVPFPIDAIHLLRV